MKVKIKKLNEIATVIPFKIYNTDFAYDLTATSIKVVETKFGFQVHYGLGFATQFTTDLGIKIAPRSSISKMRLRLTNPEGIIDTTYRGEWKIVFDVIGKKLSKQEIISINDDRKVEGIYNIGDRIAQCYILKRNDIEFIETDKLENTERQNGGFGHTGN